MTTSANRKPRALRGPNDKRTGRFGLPGPEHRTALVNPFARVLKCEFCRATFSEEYWQEKHEREFHK